jgi:hypothetical protein
MGISGSGPLMAGEEMAAMQKADAGAVWSYIHGPSPYWNWNKWPGKAGLYKGTEPHGMLLQTFVNEIAQRGVYGETGGVDHGGIVVKENYTPDRTLAAVTVMYKLKNFNPEGGDWFWVKYGPDGSVIKTGKPAGCIACHGTKKDNDYLMTGPIK